ncbi:MAG: hypothetical protein ACYC54_04615 [Sedimentisphaerales bacterium]
MNKKHLDLITLPCSSSDWIKFGNVLEQTESWEKDFVQNFTSPAEPLNDGRWRIWYGAGMPYTIAVAEGVPGEKMTKYQAVLTTGEPADAPLSIGNLPEGWRPIQSVHIKMKDGLHRLYFWAHCESETQGVKRYLAADSTDGRRFRVVDPYRPCMYHLDDRAVKFVNTICEGTSKSEVQPNPFYRTNIYRPSDEPAAAPELVCNDATTVYQLADGSFELYTASVFALQKGDRRWAYNDNAAGWVRVIDRLVSKDGLLWTGRQRVIEPDAGDPSDMQFYHLAVTYTPKGRVGMLGHYRVKDQTMDIEWCFSADGIKWIRPFRKAWLERSWPEQSVDSFGIYPPASIVHYEGKWWLFYSGVNFSHNSKLSHGKSQRTVMLAETKSIWANESV